VRDLQPAENIAVTVARSQAARGDDTGPNVTAALLLTIERLRDMPSFTQSEADDEAAAAGIDSLESIRKEAIAQRDDALGNGRMHAAVFWTHTIWWLSKAQELLAESSQT
jgi:hypothetical protein